jgi:GNAT superfamily N-acetyltransferase
VRRKLAPEALAEHVPVDGNTDRTLARAREEGLREGGGTSERITGHRAIVSSRPIDVKPGAEVADGRPMGMPAEHLPDALEIHIAPFQGDEHEAIAELCRGCASRPEDSLAGWEWSDASELERQLEQWEISPRSTLFVAREHGRVVGFCGVECYPRDGFGLVHGPAVAPAARDRGVSKALFEVALRTAVTHRAAELWAATGRDNRHAQTLYGEAGFTRDEVVALFQLTPAAHTPVAVPEHVRRATPNDLPEVLVLAESLGDDLHMTLDELASALSDPTWHVWIGGEPHALALACIDPAERWVRALATREDARRRGLGAALLSAAIVAWWADQHHEPVGLSVRAESLALVTQYHRLGFQPSMVVARFSRPADPTHTSH